jgi:hypothetical protein
MLEAIMFLFVGVYIVADVAAKCLAVCIGQLSSKTAQQRAYNVAAKSVSQLLWNKTDITPSSVNMGDTTGVQNTVHC